MAISRRRFIGMAAGALASPWLPRPDDDLAFLRGMVADLLAASRIAPGTHGTFQWNLNNTCGFPLVTPGRQGYPAYWVRDFSMAADSGMVPTEEIKNHLFLLAKCQRGATEWKLRSGATVPPFAIPDHVNFDGSPVYFPGTYSAKDDQGSGQWGTRPPFDDHYEFVHLAYLLAKQSGSRAFLNEEVEGLKLIDRLRKAFDCPETDAKTELAKTTEATRAVDFGFRDSITCTGSLFYASLLRFRAAGELAELTGEQMYKSIQRKIAENLRPAFADTRSGWYLATTEIGRQPDVWGTLYALHLGVLDKPATQKAWKTVASACRAGTIELEGAVRHVPSDRDFSSESAWEKADEPKGFYQNGAYWHTPTGWLIEALTYEDRELARKVFKSYIAHLHENDYRLKKSDAPWECFGPGKTYTQNGGYLASVAWPYAALRKLRL